MQTDNFYFAYKGQKSELFKIALKTGILTTITLGIYRFWAKTKVRQYIWSSAAAGQDRFEYHGTGFEKFFGFLIAIVVLAIYLGFVQLILIYFGLNLFQMTDDPTQVFAQTAAIYLNVLAILPLVAYARYTARRYKMTRTSWRGIRFGMDGHVWGYIWRDLFYSFLALVSLGVLTPLSTFRLEKYMTEQSYFGSARLEQNGKWTELYPAMKYIFFGVACLIAAAFISVSTLIFASIVGVLGYIVLLCGLVHYKVQSFGYLTKNKILNKTISFNAAPETKAILSIYILGGILIVLTIGLFGAVFGGVTFALFSAWSIGVLGILFAIFTYLGIYVLANALSLVWITQPVLEHMFSTVMLNNRSDLEKISKSVKKTTSDAEGFADALDIGGAI